MKIANGMPFINDEKAIGKWEITFMAVFLRVTMFKKRNRS